nr:hypothetical protein GCM10020092_025700 [Actinoplanes digitatis]
MSHPPRLATLGMALLTAASVGLLAAPAQAATTGLASVVETTKVQYKAARGKQNKVVVTRSGNTITIDDRVSVKAGKGCKAVKGDKTKVRCRTSKAPTRVRVYTYDRNDSIVNRTDLGMTADGGSAADTITGGPRGDTLRGDTGKDKLHGLGGVDYIQGGDGNDRVYGGDSGDHIDGGDDDDTLFGQNGDDFITGWIGDDRLVGGAQRRRPAIERVRGQPLGRRRPRGWQRHGHRQLLHLRAPGDGRRRRGRRRRRHEGRARHHQDRRREDPGRSGERPALRHRPPGHPRRWPRQRHPLRVRGPRRPGRRARRRRARRRVR